jgi:hypothetical protein
VRYTILYYSAIVGDRISLMCVAESMARHAATGYGKSKLGVHGPTLKNTLRTSIELLLDAANSGALTVCDINGRTASIAQIVNNYSQQVVQDGFNSSEQTMLALYSRAKHLSDWGATNGDEFEFVDRPAQEVECDLKDADGKVVEKGFYRGYIGTEQKEPFTGTVRPVLAPATELTASKPQAESASKSVAPVTPAANAPENGKTKARVGRPTVKHKKVAILSQIIGAMTAGKTLNTGSLPGSAADLFDACKRIERAQTGKATVFGAATLDTFVTWLQQSGFSMKIGRTPNNEKTYWTDLCVQTMVKMPANIFTRVYS